MGIKEGTRVALVKHAWSGECGVVLSARTSRHKKPVQVLGYWVKLDSGIETHATEDEMRELPMISDKELKRVDEELTKKKAAKVPSTKRSRAELELAMDELIRAAAPFTLVGQGMIDLDEKDMSMQDDAITVNDLDPHTRITTHQSLQVFVDLYRAVLGGQAALAKAKLHREAHRKAMSKNGRATL